MYMFGVVGETHAHDYFKVISFMKAKIYNIIRYVIDHKQKRNWNISKTKQGNQKRKDNLLCYFKCSCK